MGVLRDYFDNNRGRLIHKWLHYFDVYERHFERFRNRPVRVLEIGVSHGGSLQMWKDYFGPDARIYGVDINPDCKSLEEDRVQIYVGDQADRGFLRSLAQKIPRVDILIDDGGHTMVQQIATFEELYRHVADDGVYLCEDLHTSYWPRFGGGIRNPGSFIEYSKRLVDQLNAWHTPDAEAFEIDDLTLSTYSIHYYDSMLVLEKRRMQPPQLALTGARSFPTK